MLLCIITESSLLGQNHFLVEPYRSYGCVSGVMNNAVLVVLDTRTPGARPRDHVEALDRNQCTASRQGAGLGGQLRGDAGSGWINSYLVDVCNKQVQLA